MIHAVARVEDPYGRGDDPDRPPLSVGLFVDARILGRHVDDVYVLPRSALRGENELAVVSDAGQLRLRRVEVLKRDRETVLVSGGLSPGEQICTSPLPISVDEMWVRAVPDDRPGAMRSDGAGVIAAGGLREPAL
jgi:multidrug efflux pump subunit AcrA (membrane-fusion protein)